MTFENEREIQIHVANHMIGKGLRGPAGPSSRRSSAGEGGAHMAAAVGAFRMGERGLAPGSCPSQPRFPSVSGTKCSPALRPSGPRASVWNVPTLNRRNGSRFPPREAGSSGTSPTGRPQVHAAFPVLLPEVRASQNPAFPGGEPSPRPAARAVGVEGSCGPWRGPWGRGPGWPH